MDKTLSTQGKSTQQLRDSRSQLNQISKNIIGDTEEEIALRDKLNDAIDEQTKALRGQSSDFNTAKDRVGEYKANILEAVEELRKQQTVLNETRGELEANLAAVEEGTEEYENYSQALVVVNQDLDKVNESLGENSDEFDSSILSLEGFLKASEESGGATNALSSGLKAGTKAMGGLIKSTLTFIATPVGIVLAAIAGAFLLIKNAMNRSEESTAKVKKAFSAFSGIAQALLKFLQPLGDFLIDGLVAGFELVEKGLFKALSAIQKGLKFLGFDSAAESLGNFNEEVERSVQASKDLTDAELAFTKAQRESRKVQLQYQKEAEKLRQIRDDENKSIKERIAANDELGKVLAKQQQDELALGQKAVDFAKLKIQLYGETEDNLNALADAETELIDIEERITGQTSEQLTNRVALQKEASDQAQASKEAEAEKEKELAEAKAEAAKKAAEAAVESARFELNEYIRANKSKLDSDKFLTEQSVAEETRRLEALAQKKRDYEALRLEEGQISQIEYNEAIAQINEENQAAIDELNLARKEAEAEQRAIDAENFLQFLEEQGENEYILAASQLEKQRQLELAEAEKTGANKAVIEAKYRERKKNLDNEVLLAQMQGFQTVFDSYADILGEQTKAGKAAAIASTLISTYQGAQSAYTSLAGIPIVGPALGIAAAAAAVIAGLKKVGQIRSTSTEYAKGDILKGRNHASGGIPFSIGGMLGFEAEGGEALINKRSTSMFRPLLSAINEAGGGKKFASGSILGAASSAPSSSLIDYDLLATRISQANESLPAPVVSVEEINTVDNNVSVIESLATT